MQLRAGGCGAARVVAVGADSDNLPFGLIFERDRSIQINTMESGKVSAQVQQQINSIFAK